MSTEQKTKANERAEENRDDQIRGLIHSEPLPMIQQSIAAFRRDLPDLLRTRRGRWVAYHGGTRIGFGDSQTDLYEECFRRDLTRDEFVVCGIEEEVFDPIAEVEITSDI